jgi:hypothetical protein
MVAVTHGRATEDVRSLEEILATAHNAGKVSVVNADITSGNFPGAVDLQGLEVFHMPEPDGWYDTDEVVAAVEADPELEFANTPTLVYWFPDWDRRTVVIALAEPWHNEREGLQVGLLDVDTGRYALLTALKRQWLGSYGFLVRRRAK